MSSNTFRVRSNRVRVSPNMSRMPSNPFGVLPSIPKVCRPIHFVASDRFSKIEVFIILIKIGFKSVIDVLIGQVVPVIFGSQWMLAVMVRVVVPLGSLMVLVVIPLGSFLLWRFGLPGFAHRSGCVFIFGLPFFVGSTVSPHSLFPFWIFI